LWTDRQTKPPQHTHLPLGQFSWDEAAAFREPTGANHPGRNRLAVQPCTISGHGLESMRKSVPVVKDGSQTSLLPLVLLNDLRLELTTAGNNVTNGFGLPAQDRIGTSLQVCQELRIEDYAILDDFSQTAAVFAV